MNLVVYTSLWPNSERPNFSVFVKHRVAAMARMHGTRLRVVAPVPYFPRGIQSAIVPGHWLRDARLPEREQIDGIETWHPRHLVTPKIGMSFYAGWMVRGTEPLLRRLIHAEKIDAIDAHYIYPDGVAAVRLGQRLGLPVVVSARGTDVNLFSRMTLIRPQIRRALEQAEGIIAVSQSLKNRMVELGIQPGKIAVIRNGIDRAIFFPRDSWTARQKLGIRAGSRVVITVSSLVPLKGIDRLLDAIVAIEDRRVQLYIIGEGPERARLESRIQSMDLQDRVFLIGALPQSELGEWYAAADLFCLASEREGCPNVVIEALACGLPVIAADVGGIRELIPNEAYGTLLASPMAEVFAEAIESALTRRWDRAAIAAHGGARSWDDVAREVMAYYAKRGIRGK